MSNLQNKLFFNKYRIQKLIFSSKYSWVYQGINIINKEPIAIKLEDRNGTKHFLESEAFFLFNLKGLGIPKVISFGKSTQFIILIEELLGLALIDLMLNKKYKNNRLKSICMIALQIIDRLEFIHSKNIIHRDIKPDNFVIGRNENNKIIYLIDFGFARKYRSSRTGKHIKFKKTGMLLGSLNCMSINANKALEQSRRDDLESVGYMLILLAKLYLPWLELCKLKTMDNLTKLKKVLELKIATTPEQLCKGLPEEFIKYIQYCKKLKFEEDPDYNYLRSLFTSVLMKNNLKNDYNFFWVIKLSDSKLKKENNKERINNFKQRKNSHKRLYNQIKKSLEKETTHKTFISCNNKSYLKNANSIFLNSSNIELWKDNNKTLANKEEIEDTKNNYIKTENNSRNNNILTINHNLDYYDYLKNKEKINKSINHNKLLCVNNNNLYKLKGNILNKNILTLENNEKNFKNSLYSEIKKKRKANIPKEKEKLKKIPNNYVDFRENSHIKGNNIYKTLFEREKEKVKNKSSKVINNNKNNSLSNIGFCKNSRNRMNILKNSVIRTINISWLK
jgi:serine/threonine protein kinase